MTKALVTQAAKEEAANKPGGKKRVGSPVYQDLGEAEVLIDPAPKKVSNLKRKVPVSKNKKK